MPTTLVFGGSGKVARQITRILAQQTTPAHTVYSVIRKEEQAGALRDIGASPIIQSIEDSEVDALSATIKKCAPSTVIWSAGAGGGDPARTKAVDQNGAIKVMDAMAAAGVKRLLLVSAIDMRDRENKPQPEWYTENDLQRSDKMWNGPLGPYMQAKLAADRELRVGNTRRKLDYTILRPGSLSDDKGTGKVSAGKVHFGASISREDVARVAIECMANDGTIGLAFDIVSGDTPIPEAIKHVADEKIDCFEGRY